MDFFKNLTVLSLEQATVLPYLTYRLAHDGINVIRLEHPVYGDPNRLVGWNLLNEERMNTYGALTKAVAEGTLHVQQRCLAKSQAQIAGQLD